ncbi:unnamed protein product [Candidula unifasciata]|uniref:G-protein coupled receptors family 1 profile domain-containing protein n=1 Tax=Candidula unifasciata TaxID=100452 RepID=A0A8S3ZWZ7_9EUPU|nr:unnamed protein product [Candidula unifasciata]
MTMENCTNTSSHLKHVTLTDVYVSVFETVLLSISFVLNLIIVISVYRSPRLHTFSNIFVVALAVSDILFAAAYEIPSAAVLYIASTHQEFHFPLALQCMCLYLSFCSMICSRCCHLVVSVERWLYIAWPFVHPRVITTKSTICCLIFVWMISMLSGLQSITDCRYSYVEFMIGYATVDASVHFVAGGLMLAIYVHIGYIIGRQSVAIFKSRLAANSNDTGTINRRITCNIIRLPVTIFGTFFLFVTPFVIDNFYVYVIIGSPSFYRNNIAYDVLRVISLFHTWINFFVYVLQDKDFRSVLKCCLIKIGKGILRGRIHPIIN